jgi:aspartyl protease family protein
MHELPAWLKHATVWLLLAAAVFLGVQAWQARERATRFVIDGGALELRRGADGHYHWPGRIAGRPVEFLVDTGATGTALPAALARELGLATLGPMQSDTAGGRVQGTMVVGDIVLEGGLAARRLRMAALPDLAGPLLGMDVLGRLHWRQGAGVLHIELKEGGR